MGPIDADTLKGMVVTENEIEKQNRIDEYVTNYLNEKKEIISEMSTSELLEFQELIQKEIRIRLENKFETVIWDALIEACELLQDNGTTKEEVFKAVERNGYACAYDIAGYLIDAVGGR